MYDLVIRNGLVIDGTGRDGFPGDVAIVDDRIEAVGDLDDLRGKVEIDASGQVVCPGFIDLHSHSDIMLLAEPNAEPKVMQGITTEVMGQDGYSMAPLRKELVPEYRQFLSGLAGSPSIEWDWETMSQYLYRFDGTTSINIASMVGHGTVRMNVLGTASTAASRNDLERMGELIEQAFAEGATDVSYGLIYVPSLFANREELNYIGKLVRKLGGSVVYHIRNEANFALESLEEVLQVARDTGVRTHISHLKISGVGNWHKVDAAMEMLEGAIAEGLDISFEQYPYTAGSTLLSAILPAWVLEGGTAEALKRISDPSLRPRILHDVTNGVGRWQSLGVIAGWNVVISSVGSSKNQDKVGRSLLELGKAAGTSPLEVAIRILMEEEMFASIIIFHQSEDVVRRMMSHPNGGFGTDGVLGDRPHPRLYGTFPRVLGHYVRQEKVLRLEEAIRKSTSLAAKRLRLSDRGRIAPGMAADLVLFDPKTVIDTSTYEEPRQYPKGINWVIVNGVVTVEDGRHTGARAGRSLKPIGHALCKCH
ncbi:MAG: N-acyl-D-amino-acid deacylase family protein [Chloroflexota bacterium]|jgi:N-acyl-D-amino-acid deacylase